MWIVVMLLYGAGLRIEDCLELRVKDIDFERRQMVLRGARDRRTAGQFFPKRCGRRCRRTCATTMIYLHVLNRGALGVRSPADRL
jgi:integrase